MVTLTSQQVVGDFGVFQFAWNCPEVYWSPVEPVVVISIASSGFPDSFVHEMEFCVNDEISLVLVFSIEPAKTSNFNSTVEPPFTVFTTQSRSAG